MKSIILVVLLIVFTPFVTCQSSENEITEPQSPQPSIEQFLEETDLSDLSDLPTDPNYIKVVSLKGETPSPYGYVLRKPENFGEDGLKYPVLICLHGVGSRGNSQNNPNDINKVDQNSAIRAIKIGAWNPAVPVAVSLHKQKIIGTLFNFKILLNTSNQIMQMLQKPTEFTSVVLAWEGLAHGLI